jgi:hypothetical protein
MMAAVFVVGCAAESGEEDVASGEAMQTSASDESYASSAYEDVWIFGGSSYDVPLGCVSCSSYGSDSVLSSYGYGSNYGDTIWNAYGTYGSDYSSYSPWNSYSSSAPKLYTKDKTKFFGVFTANQYASNRTHLSKAIEVLEKGRDRR